MARVHTALALALGIAASSLVPAIAVAQSTEQPAKAPKKKAQAKAKDSAGAKDGEAAARDPSEVQKALDIAAKSLDAGKFDQAIAQANAVMEKGGLEVRATARALAIRGHAYKKQGKPAQAIADLQSAIWLKNGLNDTERAAALKARSEAYAEAGLEEPSQRAASRAQSPMVTADAAKAPAPSSVGTTPSAAATSGATSASTPSPASSSGIGEFFSNIFGGGSQKSAPETTASVSAPSPAPAAPAKEAAVSSWTDTTRVKSPSKAHTKTAAVQASTSDAVAQAAPAAKAAAPSGSFKLQLAARKSKEEAEELAATVKAGNPEAFAERKVEISEATFGSMGTFYRPRFGPYESREKSLALCATLRSKGVDCMVLEK